MNTEEFSSRNLGAIVHEVDRAFAEKDGRADKGNGKAKAGLAQHAGEVFTDLANARRLVARHGHNLRYCFPQGSWYVWDGKHWVRETTGEVMRLAKETAISIYQEAASALTEQQRKVLSSWARRSESEARLKAMVSLARSEPSIPVRPEELDAQPWLSNAQNGTINLRSGDLQEHRREDLITKQVPVAYDPDAQCPRWDDFLVEITGGNLRKAAYLQRIFGYALTGSTREQCWFFSWGAGDNGKTVLHQIMRECLGDYAQAAEFSSFITNRNDKIRNDLARLKGARLVVALEVQAGRRLDETLIKALTGQDRIVARFLFREHIEFLPECKLFLAGNHKPEIRETTHAMWRRVRLIPFDVKIPKENQDKNLIDKLRCELPGILAWAVRGCLLWQQHGLDEPKEVLNATQDYREESDPLGQFLSERCTQLETATATARQLYSAYTEWCDENGEKRPMSQRAFGMRLTERGFTRKRGTKGAHNWIGIGLLSDG